MTYAQWEAESNRLARALAHLGVVKGDRVSIYLRAEEGLRFMVAYSAVHKAGAVAVPTNTRLADAELERLLGHAEVRVILTDPELSPLAHDVAAAVPSTQHALVSPATGETGDPSWSWETVASGHDTDAFQVELGGDDLADILYTSGTTGLPKGVAIRHRNVALIPARPIRATRASTGCTPARCSRSRASASSTTPCSSACPACTSRASTPGGGSRSSKSCAPSSSSSCRRWPSCSWPIRPSRTPSWGPSSSAPSGARPWPPPPCGPCRSACPRRRCPTATA